MGVERKNPRLNWMISFGLVILGGTCYRIASLNRKFLNIEIKKLLQNIGSYIPEKKTTEKLVLPSER
jgi:hypothetical protein